EPHRLPSKIEHVLRHILTAVFGTPDTLPDGLPDKADGFGPVSPYLLLKHGHGVVHLLLRELALAGRRPRNDIGAPKRKLRREILVVFRLAQSMRQSAPVHQPPK